MDIKGYRVTEHVQQRMADRGLTMAQLIDIILNPSTTYASAKFPGQVRYVKGDFCVCVDTVRRSIPTFFYNGRLDDKNYKGSAA